MHAWGTFETLRGWGLDVATTDPNSIKNTSVRPYSVLNGKCEEISAAQFSSSKIAAGKGKISSESRRAVSYSTTAATRGTFELFSMEGMFIARLPYNEYAPGSHTLHFGERLVNPGVCRIR